MPSKDLIKKTRSALMLLSGLLRSKMNAIEAEPTPPQLANVKFFEAKQKRLEKYDVLRRNARKLFDAWTEEEKQEPLELELLFKGCKKLLKVGAQLDEALQGLEEGDPKRRRANTMIDGIYTRIAEFEDLGDKLKREQREACELPLIDLQLLLNEAERLLEPTSKEQNKR